MNDPTLSRHLDALKNTHWTREQLEALYVVPRLDADTCEYFWERVGMMARPHGDLDDLAAMNLAHLAVQDWLLADQHRMAMELMVMKAEELRLMRLGYDVLKSAPEGKI